VDWCVGGNMCVVAETGDSELPARTELSHMPTAATLNIAQPI